jgi:hypothetical protein
VAFSFEEAPCGSTGFFTSDQKKPRAFFPGSGHINQNQIKNYYRQVHNKPLGDYVKN